MAVTPVAPGHQCEGAKNAVSSFKRARMQRRTPNSNEEPRTTLGQRDTVGHHLSAVSQGCSSGSKVASQRRAFSGHGHARRLMPGLLGEERPRGSKTKLKALIHAGSKSDKEKSCLVVRGEASREGERPP